MNIDGPYILSDSMNTYLVINVSFPCKQIKNIHKTKHQVSLNNLKKGKICVRFIFDCSFFKSPKSNSNYEGTSPYKTAALLILFHLSFTSAV